MSLFILDFGSGETCQNNIYIVAEMIDQLALIDTGKHTIIIKWQLFDQRPERSPKDLKLLCLDIFAFAYIYAKQMGYKTTASIFDLDSLSFLQRFNIPFIKLACCEDMYKYIGAIPLDVKIIASVPDMDKMYELKKKRENINFMYCIPEYPADQNKYESLFGRALSLGISDHSPDLRLFKKYQPLIYERHYKLEDSTGYDAGVHASTPEKLRGVL